MHPGLYPVFPHVLFKLHDAVTGGKNGEVTAQAYSLTGMHLGAELTHDNIARKYRLTAETFYAASLSRTIAAVA